MMGDQTSTHCKLITERVCLHSLPSIEHTSDRKLAEVISSYIFFISDRKLAEAGHNHAIQKHEFFFFLPSIRFMPQKTI